MSKEKKAQIQRRYYWKNRDRILEKQRTRQRTESERKAKKLRNHYRLNRESYMLRNAFRRAKESGKDFDLTIEDIVIPETCPILGIPISLGENSKTLAGSPYLDRIDNEKGYVKGNVWVISHKANAMKNSATISELLKFAYWATSTFGSYAKRATISV